jgi:hypothetical protein
MKETYNVKYKNNPPPWKTFKSNKPIQIQIRENNKIKRINMLIFAVKWMYVHWKKANDLWGLQEFGWTKLSRFHDMCHNHKSTLRVDGD